MFNTFSHLVQTPLDCTENRRQRGQSSSFISSIMMFNSALFLSKRVTVDT